MCAKLNELNSATVGRQCNTECKGGFLRHAPKPALLTCALPLPSVNCAPPQRVPLRLCRVLPACRRRRLQARRSTLGTLQSR